ncbi:vWA domain-containing protein [Paenarthrobacter ureafaciens]|uniref:vWA domain-containing protein n=1 Tax=Paenarthrobacter ureafaciens TaxID=37931 RepID=UPI001916F7AF|nr:VWA domain-containing protein [Paenarthrobacter ureafaciens]QQQ64442.1 VWA domain-containing protein [Paenarthrobacter ureafaciens]
MSSQVGLKIFYGFVGALRDEGMTIGAEQAQLYLEALSVLDLQRRDEVFWAGRATLCRSRSDFGPYDRTFGLWFSSESPIPVPLSEGQEASLPDAADGDSPQPELEQQIALASKDESLQHRDVALMSAEEKSYLAEAFAALPVREPLRRARYKRTHRHKRIDPAHTVRDNLRRGGEPGRLQYRFRTKKPRRVVLIVDVSGSMEAYADSFFRFGHRLLADASDTTEVFSIGTRLTRVTSALQHPDPEVALLDAGLVVPDWSGGTRLGEALAAFITLWGQHAMLRGSVLVIASDGWERGDPRDLARQVSRLHGLAHRVIWANPHRGKSGYEPIQSGIKAVLPHVDALVAGHTMAAFRDLADRIAHA